MGQLTPANFVWPIADREHLPACHRDIGACRALVSA